MSTELTLTYGATAAAEIWFDWNGLNTLELEGHVGLRYKPGIGREATSYRADLSVYLDEVDTGIRSGTGVALAFGFRRPVAELWEVNGSYRYSSYSADHTVFDEDRHQFSATVSRFIGEAWSVDGTLSYLDGDFTSTVSGAALPGYPGPGYAASWPDPTFGAGYTAYRYDGSGFSIGFGASYVTAGGDLIVLLLERATIDADAGPEYSVRRLGVNWSRDF